MSEDELPVNTMTLMIEVKEDGQMALFSGHNLSNQMGKDEFAFLTDMMNGLFLSFDELMNHFASVGESARIADELMEQGEIIFEADDELVEAIKDKKIIPFDKNKLN